MKRLAMKFSLRRKKYLDYDEGSNVHPHVEQHLRSQGRYAGVGAMADDDLAAFLDEPEQIDDDTVASLLARAEGGLTEHPDGATEHFDEAAEHPDGAVPARLLATPSATLSMPPVPDGAAPAASGAPSADEPGAVASDPAGAALPPDLTFSLAPVAAAADGSAGETTEMSPIAPGGTAILPGVPDIARDTAPAAPDAPADEKEESRAEPPCALSSEIVAPDLVGLPAKRFGSESVALLAMSAHIVNVYRSRDGRLCVFEDESGHIVAMNTGRFA